MGIPIRSIFLRNFTKREARTNYSRLQTINTTTAAGFTACRFSFCLATIHGARGQTVRGAKNAPQGLFSFRGCNYTKESANERQSAKFQAREGNGNESESATRATTPKKRHTRRENDTPLLTTPPKAETPTGAKNHGSRLESSERLTDSAQRLGTISDGRSEAHRRPPTPTPTPPRARQYARGM